MVVRTVKFYFKTLENIFLEFTTTSIETRFFPARSATIVVKVKVASDASILLSDSTLVNSPYMEIRIDEWNDGNYITRILIDGETKLNNCEVTCEGKLLKENEFVEFTINYDVESLTLEILSNHITITFVHKLDLDRIQFLGVRSPGRNAAWNIMQVQQSNFFDSN